VCNAKACRHRVTDVPKENRETDANTGKCRCRFTAMTAAQEPDAEELQECAQEVAHSGVRARAEEREAALSRLIISLEHSHPQVAGLAAITGGALVEQGASPLTLGKALVERVPGILGDALRFTDRCVAELGLDQPSEEGEAEDDGDEDEGSVRVAGKAIPEEVVERVFADDPVSVQAYGALDSWCYPAIACLTREPTLREAARQNPAFAEAAIRLNNLAESGGLSFLSKLLLVLDDEPLLVLHPESKKGFRCRMGGIADNFQLHTLLMDTLIAPEPGGGRGFMAKLLGRGGETMSGLPDGLRGRRPDPASVAVARGEGPQEGHGSVVGAWNLYNWTAVDPGSGMFGDGPLAGMGHWIWNEGVPADITPFEGLRIVLLGAPAYERSWNSVRLFDALPAYVRVEEMLTPQGVEEWLARLAAAIRPGESTTNA
jgi:hypothetical protein